MENDRSYVEIKPRFRLKFFIFKLNIMLHFNPVGASNFSVWLEDDIENNIEKYVKVKFHNL